MVEDNQIVPLAPNKNNPKSDEEFAAMKQNISRRKESSKCLVYVLAGIVIVSAAFLIFALVVLRPTSPEVELSFIQVKNLRYSAGNGGNSSLPRLNMTLETELRIKNSNFGQFKFDNTSARVLYGAMIVGESKLQEGRVGVRDTRRVNLRVEVRSDRLRLNSTEFSSDVNSGILKMSSYAELNGRVSLFKIVKKKKTASMDCSFNLNLRGGSVEDLVCITD